MSTHNLSYFIVKKICVCVCEVVHRSVSSTQAKGLSLNNEIRDFGLYMHII